MYIRNVCQVYCFTVFTVAVLFFLLDDDNFMLAKDIIFPVKKLSHLPSPSFHPFLFLVVLLIRNIFLRAAASSF